MKAALTAVREFLVALAVAAFAALCGCTPTSDTATTPLTVVDCTKPLAVVPPFALTPAPPNETPLQRWQRTKADYDRAQAIEDKATDEIEHATTYLAIMPLVEAEKALAAAKCGNVCQQQQ